MRKTSVFFLIALFVGFSTGIMAQVFSPADGTKVEDPMTYFQGDLSGFQVSPSGKGVAFLRYENSRWVLYWDNINGGRETRISKAEEPSVVDFRWVGDDAVVYSAGEGLVATELHRYETFGKVSNRLTSTPVWIRFLDSHVYNNGTTILMKSSADAAAPTIAYSILPGMRELRQVSSGNNFSWIEGIGNGATYSFIKSGNETLFMNCMQDGGEKLGSLVGLCSLKGLALASKSDAVAYMLSDLNRNDKALVKFDMRSAKESEVIFERPGSTISKVLFSSIDATPLVAWYSGQESGFEAISKSFGPILSEIIQKLPHVNGFDIVHSDLSGNVWIVSILNCSGSRQYYHYNIANHELKAFGNAVVTPCLEPVVEKMAVAGDDEILVRYYLPDEITSKSLGVIVFRDSPWNDAISGSMDGIIQRLVREGFMVADVDIAYSAVSRKKLLHAGYDQLIDRVLDQIPVIQKMMVGTYGLQKSLITVIGEGIGSRAAMRVAEAHTAIVLRTVHINGAPELSNYLSSKFPVESSDKDYIMGYGESNQVKALSYISREPLFMNAAVKGPYYTVNTEPAIKKLTQQGKSPEGFVVGPGCGPNFSEGALKTLSDKLVGYARQ